ncbi:Hcp family type VI secretion system effector [Enterobacterales bacterium CwR94]|nr:Hcp family type VI secretion system effector [Enterobacterales bacterium CwR94]
MENAEENPERYGIKDPLNEEHSHLEHIELFYEKITWTYRGGHTIHCDAWNERTTA